MGKILIIGANGFLGQKLLQILSPRFDVVGTWHSRETSGTVFLDVTNAQQVQEVIEKNNPTIVIFAAVFADMDRCETEKAAAIETNVTGIKNVARYCQERLLIYYSTDAIFNGMKGNYCEDDSPDPVNFYGETKLRGEYIVKTLPQHLILRTSFLYSDQLQSPKFIPWLIRTLSQQKTVNVATDLTTNPTLIDDLADATISLIRKKRCGTYHVAGASALSCYDMALYIAQKWGFDQSLIHPVKRKDLLWKANRAENATLCIDKLHTEGIHMSTFEEGIEKIRKSL